VEQVRLAGYVASLEQVREGCGRTSLRDGTDDGPAQGCHGDQGQGLCAAGYALPSVPRGLSGCFSNAFQDNAGNGRIPVTRIHSAGQHRARLRGWCVGELGIDQLSLLGRTDPCGASTGLPSWRRPGKIFIGLHGITHILLVRSGGGRIVHEPEFFFHLFQRYALGFRHHLQDPDQLPDHADEEN
jgi:hypothetical protein